MTGYTDAI